LRHTVAGNAAYAFAWECGMQGYAGEQRCGKARIYTFQYSRKHPFEVAEFSKA